MKIYGGGRRIYGSIERKSLSKITITTPPDLEYEDMYNVIIFPQWANFWHSHNYVWEVKKNLIRLWQLLPATH